MHIEEGQVYEGGVSLSGEAGPFRRWLVVAPFGKMHIHSIDTPLELHCWPVNLLQAGIGSGRLSYIGTDPDHPAIEVQRIKERLGVRDAHLSLSLSALERLVAALRHAVAGGAVYAPYLAGEILTAVSHSILPLQQGPQLLATVHDLLSGAGPVAASYVGGDPIEIGTGMAGA